MGAAGSGARRWVRRRRTGGRAVLGAVRGSSARAPSRGRSICERRGRCSTGLRLGLKRPGLLRLCAAGAAARTRGSARSSGTPHVSVRRHHVGLVVASPKPHSVDLQAERAERMTRTLRIARCAARARRRLAVFDVPGQMSCSRGRRPHQRRYLIALRAREVDGSAQWFARAARGIRSRGAARLLGSRLPSCFRCQAQKMVPAEAKRRAPKGVGRRHEREAPRIRTFAQVSGPPPAQAGTPRALRCEAPRLAHGAPADALGSLTPCFASYHFLSLASEAHRIPAPEQARCAATPNTARDARTPPSAPTHLSRVQGDEVSTLMRPFTA